MAMAGGASACGITAGQLVAVAQASCSALDGVIASFCRLPVDIQAKLAEMRANRDELRQGRDLWHSRVERLLIDQHEPDSGGSNS